MDVNVDQNEILVPPSIALAAEKAVEQLIPGKSKDLYEKEYKSFCEWRINQKAKGVNEAIILAYLSERSTRVKSSSLWSYYSQLKKMLTIKENIDISRFSQVSAFLKKQSVGYNPKKSKVFTREDLEKFLVTATDEKCLLQKVVFIMGLSGGCRIGELVKMTVDDVDDREGVLVVDIPDTKTYKKRVFTVINGSSSVNAIDVYRKYRKLRPLTVSHKRLFLNYKNGKCTVQPVGLNTIAKIPQNIAVFLGLWNPEEYTGHSFRRSSATILADAGANMSELKRHGAWRSNSVVEGYIEDSLRNKIGISERILGSEHNAQKSNTISGVTMATLSSCTNVQELSVNSGETTYNTSSKEVTIPLDGKRLIHFNGLTNCNFYFGSK